jgi:hypothetical protein
MPAPHRSLFGSLREFIKLLLRKYIIKKIIQADFRHFVKTLSWIAG